MGFLEIAGGIAFVGWGLYRLLQGTEREQTIQYGTYPRHTYNSVTIQPRTRSPERNIWETRLERNHRHYQDANNSAMEVRSQNQSQHYQNMDVLARSLQQIRLIDEYNENYFPVAYRVEIIRNVSLVPRPLWMTAQTSFELKQVDPFSGEFQNVVGPIVDSDNHTINIISVYKIGNPYLKRQFELKKLQNGMRNYRERKMYHTTVERNISSICTNNFNWRLSGASRGSKYGVGVSFTPYPDFAHQFCRSRNVKVMFVVKVLIGRSHIGSKEQVLPNADFDTTCAISRKVFVKFEDSEFCPEYVVYYRFR